MKPPHPPRTFAALALAAVLASAVAAPAAHAQKAFVLTSDFVTGSLARVNPATFAVSDNVNSVWPDARARVVRDTLYLLNRFGADNVQIVDTNTNATIRQFSTGNGSNPSDLAYVSARKIYVSRYESADLWIMDPRTGAHTGTISLARWADADGIPEMDRLGTYGPYVFVALQRLDRNAGFVPTDSSLVAVIDSRADTLVDCDADRPGTQAILLPRLNPVTEFTTEPGVGLLIGCVGRFGVLDGGVVRVDPFVFAPGAVVITEQELGGDIGELVWHTAQKSYAIVSDASFNSTLVSWNPSTGHVLAPIFSPGGFSLPDMGLDTSGRLWVCCNAFAAPGLHVFGTSTDTEVHAPLTFALPPAYLAFGVGEAFVGAPPEARAAAVALSAPAPNPARGAVAMELTLAAAGEAGVRVFDPAGRLVRTLASGARAAGRSRVVWDLCDSRGLPVAPGLYLVRASTGGREVARRVAVVR